MGVSFEDIESELYEVVKSMEAIDSKELPPELAEKAATYINELKYNRAVKADGFVGYCKHLAAEAKAIRGEMAELEKRANARESTLKFIKMHWQQIMESFNETRIKGLIHSVYIASSESCKIDDESLIPDEWFRVKREVKKQDVLAAMKSGVTIPGCSIGISKSLRMR